jgi:hypothetical protein
MIKYLIAIVVLILLGLMTSCGPYEVNVKHTHILEIDLSKVEEYFQASCEQEQPDDVDGCTANKVAQFLNMVLPS